MRLGRLGQGGAEFGDQVGDADAAVWRATTSCSGFASSSARALLRLDMGAAQLGRSGSACHRWTLVIGGPVSENRSHGAAPGSAAVAG